MASTGLMKVRSMRLSKEGAEFLARREGSRLKPYQDQAGVWTVGIGHTKGVTHLSPDITKEQEEEFLREDLLWVEKALKDYVKVDLFQWQYDALVSFVFNVGSPAFKNSTLLRKLNDFDKIGASEQFLIWNKIRHPVTGALVINNGLINRRKFEKDLFILGIYA